MPVHKRQPGGAILFLSNATLAIYLYPKVLMRFALPYKRKLR